MNKKITCVLSMYLVAGMALTFSENTVNADEITNNYSVEEILSSENVKTEDISSSIPKTENPVNNSIQISNIDDKIDSLYRDLGGDIKLPKTVDLGSSTISGKLANGVGVTVYKVSSEDLAKGSVVLNSSMSLSDTKYSIQSKNGEFSIRFDNTKLKENEHFIICVSYSITDSSGKDIHKTFLFDTVYQKKDNAENVPVEPQNENRISGSDRYVTNLNSIKKSYKKGDFDTVIVSSGDNFADALTAGPLSMKNKYPILFAGRNGISSDGLKFLNEYGVKSVLIVGGENSVPKNVETQLVNMNVRRISGVDRYETSNKLLAEFGTAKHLILTDGRKFADALSATPLSKKLNSPILLVNNLTNIPTNIDNYLDVYIIGGKSSVNQSAEDKLKEISNGKSVYRIYGGDRVQTSYQVAKQTKYASNLVVNGNNFPDALSSANLVASNPSNLLLINKAGYPTYMSELIEGKTNIVIGGYNSVMKNVFNY